ncbi:MAG: alanine racemase, partial [Actinobacteria bacterium]|nr:alanine racemase [Actinomycetota bacterium]
PDELATAASVAHRILLSDPAAARTLGAHAAGSPVEILLTVDLGDRREGVLPDAAPAVARQIAILPGVVLAGISVNFACLSGQLPTQDLFRHAEAVLVEVADACAVEPQLSLGGTCVMQHLDGYHPRFRTEIRSGGGPIYGYDFVSGAGLDGLQRTDPVLTGRARVLPQAAGAGGARRSRRLRPRARGGPAGRRRELRPSQPRPARLRARRPAAAASGLVSRRRHQRRERAHHARTAPSR